MKKISIEAKIEELLNVREQKMKELRSIVENPLTTKSRFELIAPAYGLRRDCIGAEFTRCQTVYKIIGINEGCRIYPIIVESHAKVVTQLGANVVSESLANNNINVIGIEVAKYRSAIDNELRRLQDQYVEIINGRDKLKTELPTIGTDEYFNKDWTIEENEKAILGFKRRRSCIIAKWTEAATDVKSMAIRCVVAFLISAYQIKPWRAKCVVERSFGESNFLDCMRITESNLANLDEAFSVPELAELERWIEAIKSKKQALLIKVR